MQLFKKSWNDNYWNKSEVKSLQGLMALGIIFHHMAQKTCAPWLPEEFITHGLEPFLNLGYLFVGLFFFCSGFGLYKSIKQKPDYLKGFIGKHIRPIILLFIISNVCFYMIGQTLNNYTWFIYAIIYLYVAFYISFKNCKSEKKAIALLAVFIVLYVAYCEIFVLGTWVYNTIGIFMTGLLFAKYEDKIVSWLREHFAPVLITTASTLVIAFIAALHFGNRVVLADTRLLYYVIRWLSVILQFVAAASFSILLYVLNQKISILCKPLEFLGGLSLELYLIHVLFVEMFGYCFVNTENEAICYVKKILLYILIVVSLSIISAYALWWARKGFSLIYQKFIDLFKALGKDIKKYSIYLGIGLLLLTGILILMNRTGESDRQEKVLKYVNANISYVTVNDMNISYYEKGEGDKTILIFKGDYDPCPTLTQRKLADELSSDYRVVLVDLPGSGFSDEPKTERTIENICDELHGVAAALKLDNYILLSEMISGAYALYYVNQYPGEVSAVVSVDGEYSNYEKALFRIQNLSVFEFDRQIKRDAVLRYTGMRLVDALGYKTIVWPVRQSAYARNIGFKNDDVSYTAYFKNSDDKTVMNERFHTVDNILKTEGLKYPEGVQVVDLVSDGKIIGYRNIGVDIDAHLDDLCENKETHSVARILDGRYCLVINPVSIKKLIKENLN